LGSIGRSTIVVWFAAVFAILGVAGLYFASINPDWMFQVVYALEGSATRRAGDARVEVLFLQRMAVAEHGHPTILAAHVSGSLLTIVARPEYERWWRVLPSMQSTAPYPNAVKTPATIGVRIMCFPGTYVICYADAFRSSFVAVHGLPPNVRVRIVDKRGEPLLQWPKPALYGIIRNFDSPQQLLSYSMSLYGPGFVVAFLLMFIGAMVLRRFRTVGVSCIVSGVLVIVPCVLLILISATCGPCP